MEKDVNDANASCLCGMSILMLDGMASMPLKTILYTSVYHDENVDEVSDRHKQFTDRIEKHLVQRTESRNKFLQFRTTAKALGRDACTAVEIALSFVDSLQLLVAR